MPANSDASGETDDQYHSALGSFIETFAVAELSLFWALEHYTKVAGRTAQVLFERTTPETTIKILTAICSNDPTIMEWPIMSVALKQLDRIRIIRNQLIHLGTAIDSDGTRRVKANTRRDAKGEVKRARVTARVLSWMENDLANISLYLMIWGRWPADKPKTANEAANAAAELEGIWLFHAEQ